MFIVPAICSVPFQKNGVLSLLHPPPLTTTYASVAFYALFFDKSLVSLLDNGALYPPIGQRLKIHFLHIVTFHAGRHDAENRKGTVRIVLKN